MSTSEALVIPSADLWRAPDWQRLWLSTRASQATPWRSLALVPASRGTSPQTILQIATALARTGMVHVGAPIHIADATNITLAQLEPFTEVLNRHVEAGEMVIVALAPAAECVATVPLAKCTDAALLCVVAAQMAAPEARETIAQIGAQRFIGSTIFRIQP
jgi:hypothetical protein